MTTLEEFKALRAGVAPEVQTELYGLFISDPDAARQRMIEIGAEQGLTLTSDEEMVVRHYNAVDASIKQWQQSRSKQSKGCSMLMSTRT